MKASFRLAFMDCTIKARTGLPILAAANIQSKPGRTHLPAERIALFRLLGQQFSSVKRVGGYGGSRTRVLNIALTFDCIDGNDDITNVERMSTSILNIYSPCVTPRVSARI